ncbi:hypothetical protein C1645_817551 [Glomus cerebriforme]|uniref:Uncharacterized protein n=1 Tax=Glomus cerebriforme TaxID=658196 RepID=A0A397T945_9GLOM|nr:hypothetical protein C1645_817551 [Glomus cerebriforme]
MFPRFIYNISTRVTSKVLRKSKSFSTSTSKSNIVPRYESEIIKKNLNDFKNDVQNLIKNEVREVGIKVDQQVIEIHGIRTDIQAIKHEQAVIKREQAVEIATVRAEIQTGAANLRNEIAGKQFQMLQYLTASAGFAGVSAFAHLYREKWGNRGNQDGNNREEEIRETPFN